MFWPALIFLGVVGYDIFSERSQTKTFFKSELNTIIIKKGNNFLAWGKLYDFTTKNNIVITRGNSDCGNLEIGDSIAKNTNSWKFDVYKKDAQGGYKFYENCKYLRGINSNW